jgi:uncharacterized surface protein with fasciclin (FAS1) repeats
LYNNDYQLISYSLLIIKNYNQTFSIKRCYYIKQYKMKLKSLFFSVFAIIASTITVNAQKTVVDIAVGSKDHTTLVAAVKAADLVATLQSAGPFTVFAPTNAAFAKLPAGTLEFLLKPENKSTLAKILTYHVISGNFNATAVVKAIKDGGGSVTLKTVSGGNLVASIKADKVILTDEKGATATVIATDLKADNGLIHVIDAVVLPK